MIWYSKLSKNKGVDKIGQSLKLEALNELIGVFWYEKD